FQRSESIFPGCLALCRAKPGALNESRHLMQTIVAASAGIRERARAFARLNSTKSPTRTAIASTITVARTASERTSRCIVFRPRSRRTDRLGQDFGVRGHHHNLPDRSHPDAFTAHFGLVAQREMNDAPLAAVHRAEVERLARFLHALRGGKCAHA